MRKLAKIIVVVVALHGVPVRKSQGEDRFDHKMLIYQEDDGRIRVLEPGIFYQREVSPTLTFRFQGVYNSITGATPTGAPPAPAPARSETVLPMTTSLSTWTPSYSSSKRSSGSSSYHYDDDDDDDDDDDRFEEKYEREDDDDDDKKVGLYQTRRLSKEEVERFFHSLTGASGYTPPPPPPPPPPADPGIEPAAAPAPQNSSQKTSSQSSPSPAPAAPSGTGTKQGGVPTQEIEDERWAFNLELAKKVGRHTPTLQLSYSTESDYDSYGIAIKDAIEANNKNTTYSIGAAITHDIVKLLTNEKKNKDSFDIILGVTQVMTPKTLLTANISLGRTEGYLSDPYKVAEVNGQLVPEKRPSERDKRILYFGVNHYVEELEGAIEAGYRFYTDSFGILTHTYELAWYQKLNPQWVLKPILRYYQQSEADFYGVRFTGSPEYYSADHRLSAMRALGYGIKLIWTPLDWISWDVALERYLLEGLDDETPSDAYSSATIITFGGRIWF